MNTIDAFVEEAESKKFYLEVERNNGKENSWTASYVTGPLCQLELLGGVKEGQYKTHCCMNHTLEVKFLKSCIPMQLINTAVL